jgi:mono/diheme cytochrome c family protein
MVSRTAFRARCAFAILSTVALWASPSPAQDEARVKAGLDAWKNAGCSECHGAFADGERERDEAPVGANLRSTRLDNAAITEVIRCGRPNTGMPRFDDGAYTQRACNGQEIELVVAYLRARVIGKRAVTPEECTYYYGDLADTFCDKEK